MPKKFKQAKLKPLPTILTEKDWKGKMDIHYKADKKNKFGVSESARQVENDYKNHGCWSEFNHKNPSKFKEMLSFKDNLLSYEKNCETAAAFIKKQKTRIHGTKDTRLHLEAMAKAASQYLTDVEIFVANHVKALEKFEQDRKNRIAEIKKQGAKILKETIDFKASSMNEKLKDKKFYKIFSDFLNKEDNIENLNCYKMLQTKYDLKDILTKFIGSDSGQQVNVGEGGKWGKYKASYLKLEAMDARDSDQEKKFKEAEKELRKLCDTLPDQIMVNLNDPFLGRFVFEETYYRYLHAKFAKKMDYDDFELLMQ